jgi:predicted PurR-regulated permease PerM
MRRHPRNRPERCARGLRALTGTVHTLVAVSVPPPRVELTVSNRTLLRVLAITALFIFLIQLRSTLHTVLIELLISVFLAIALNPLVSMTERRLRLKHGPAAILVFLVTILVVVVFLIVIFTPLYNEVRSFAQHLPEYLDKAEKSRLFKDLDQRYDLLSKLRTESQSLPNRLPATASAALGFAGTIASAVFETITILFLTLFLLLELPAIGRSVVSLLPPQHADTAIRMQSEISQTVARYVASNIAVSIFAGLVTWISLIILGVPFALVLALLMALFDLLPLIGATLGGAIVVLVATITVSVTAGIIMLVVLIVYQQTENHLVQPIVMKRSVAVSPLIVIVSVLVGAALLGILGALLAIPVAGSIQIALRDIVAARRMRVAELYTMSGREPPT